MQYKQTLGQNEQYAHDYHPSHQLRPSIVLLSQYEGQLRYRAASEEHQGQTCGVSHSKGEGQGHHDPRENQKLQGKQ
jgi:hypothetical protein